MKKSKLLFSLLLSATATSLAAVSAACVTTKEQETQPSNVNKLDAADYDLGLATEPLNNLNYVLKQSVNKIAPSLVDSFLKNGPTDALKSVLNTSKFNMSVMDTGLGQGSSNFDNFFNKTKKNPSAPNGSSALADDNGYGKVPGSVYGLHDFQIFGGLGRATEGEGYKEGATTYAFPNPKNSNNYMAVTGITNHGKNVWSNGDIVTAQDMRDYLEYILDYNNGSEKFDQIKKMSIQGAEEFTNAQVDYNKKHGQFYKNPWGRRPYIKSELSKYRYVQDPNYQVWQSQVPGDEKEVQAIKDAALKFSFYTGQIFLDYTNEDIIKNLDLNPQLSLTAETQDFRMRDSSDANKIVTVKLVKNVYLNPYQAFDLDTVNRELKPKIKTLAFDENSFTVVFDENKTPDLNFLLGHILMQLYPVNRKYIETETGGISDYGTTAEKFLTSGPFVMKPSDVVLGPQGNIVLTKNKDYFDVENVIPRKIKILFSTEKNINAIFFKDGYISQTIIPGTEINNFWTNPATKEYLKKNNGYGTIALGFNLDPETNANSYIQDQNIRNAIYYALDREEMLRYVGWEFSFPVNNWTAYGQYKTFDGRNLEMFFNQKQIDAKNGKTFDLLNYDYIVHLSKSYNFENTVRKDYAFDLKTAQFYLEEFKKAHPGLEGITLKYLNNSSDEQKKAGQFLKEKIEAMSNGFIRVEIKSLPENVFGSYYETGQFDFVYQNYDKIGGNSPQDYISAFFKRDGINSLEGNEFGFKDNPTGDYTYGDYFTKLVVDKLFEGSLERALATEINVIQEKINSNNDIKSQFDQVYKKQSKPEIIKFAETYTDTFANEIASSDIVNKATYTNKFIKDILQYLATQNANIKETKLRHAAIYWILTQYGVEKIDQLTAEARTRLHEGIVETKAGKKLNFWLKAIDLGYQRLEENTQQYSDRLNAFFSGNFTNEEIEQGWSQDYIYGLIATYEKIVRDASFVVPLMEVDTNWEVSKIAGISSVFTFDLQYAYDVTKPPRPGLPRNVGGHS
ncbi:ABC transporter substrate-binding protein [Mycoplasma buteonis]|uniref:ABC transporter substrate-binding protein n=1 Tax=Mycoplasma buteonis TaxID=171280 RepID=UPI00056441BC|nr:ABC transporter substrate-binding protein [Mycoplasma buteonis]